MIIGVSGSGKTNSLLNLISEQGDIDKVYLYDQKAFTKCSNTMDDVYENIDEYNPTRKRKILVAFDDTIADTMTNKKLN